MKKPKIAWVTDTTASLSDSFIQQHNIHIVPMYIIFGQTSYKEKYDLTDSAFYEKLQSEKELPSTSQPSIGELAELYTSLKNQYEKVIAIHVTGNLSGTCQASIAAAEIAGVEAFILDSQIGSYPLGLMIQKGVLMEEEGKTYEEIIACLQSLPSCAELYLIPGSLTQLHKGGRVSGSQALLATLLNVKVIIRFEQGKAVLCDKVRTDRKAKERIFHAFAEQASRINEASIIHANCPDRAEEWRAELSVLHPNISFTTTMLSPVPGTHAGQGSLGLSWIRTEEKI